MDCHIDPGDHFSDEPDYRDSWPRHCVVGTAGVDFHPAFDPSAVEAVFRKGHYSAAYSGFEGADDDGHAAGRLAARNATSTRSTSSASPPTTASRPPRPMRSPPASPPGSCWT